MTESDVDSGNFFVLQNVANNVRAGGVGANGKFANAITVFVRAGVEPEVVAQIFILGPKTDNATVFDFNGERVGLKIAVALTQIIADHPIDDERAVGVHWRGENFAAG